MTPTAPKPADSLSERVAAYAASLPSPEQLPLTPVDSLTVRAHRTIQAATGVDVSIESNSAAVVAALLWWAVATNSDVHADWSLIEELEAGFVGRWFGPLLDLQTEAAQSQAADEAAAADAAAARDQAAADAAIDGTEPPADPAPARPAVDPTSPTGGGSPT